MKKIILVLLISAFNVTASSIENQANIKTENISDSLPATAIQKLYPSFADIVEPLMPAVVNIQIEYAVKQNNKFKHTPLPEKFFSDNMFDFFERQFNIPFLFEEPAYVGSGSGFIIDSAGFIVTNYHVVSNAESIKVKLSDNTEYAAKLIGGDAKTDLALLKIESKTSLVFVTFGKSSEVRVGDLVIAIGNQFGLGGTVTTGIISFKGRDIDLDGDSIINNFLQTDAAINKGNSGGPMFNLKGEVIGVNTAIYSPSPAGTNIGIGFAIPSDSAQKIIEELKTHGEIARGTLDIIAQELTEDIAEALGMEETNGVLVVEPLANGAAQKAGIKSGDVITNFAEQKVDNLRKLQVLVAQAPIDQETEIGIIRSGKAMKFNIKIIKASTSTKNNIKNQDEKQPQDNISDSIQKHSVTFSNITQKQIRNYNLPENTTGIMVTKIIKGQKTYALKIGDIIVEANQNLVGDVIEFNEIFEKALAAKRKNIMLLVKRQNMNIYIAFPLL